MTEKLLTIEDFHTLLRIYVVECNLSPAYLADELEALGYKGCRHYNWALPTKPAAIRRARHTFAYRRALLRLESSMAYCKYTTEDVYTYRLMWIKAMLKTVPVADLNGNRLIASSKDIAYLYYLVSGERIEPSSLDIAKTSFSKELQLRLKELFQDPEFSILLMQEDL